MEHDIQTNLSTKNNAALHSAAQHLLDAAMDYWKEYQRAVGHDAVVWLSDTDGRLIILTRGEYRSQLLCNIEHLRREEDIYSFGEDDKK